MLGLLKSAVHKGHIFKVDISNSSDKEENDLADKEKKANRDDALRGQEEEITIIKV